MGALLRSAVLVPNCGAGRGAAPEKGPPSPGTGLRLGGLADAAEGADNWIGSEGCLG